MAKKRGKTLTVADIEAQERKVAKLREELPVEEARLSEMKIALIESTSQEYGFDMKDILDLMKENAKSSKPELFETKENNDGQNPFAPTN